MGTLRRKRGASGWIGLVLFLLVLSSCQTRESDPTSGAWTPQDVESRWHNPAPDTASGPYWIRFGWDATRRFYAAVPTQGGNYTNVTIVDRINGRWCTLGTANWVQAEFGTDSYEVHTWNQYGWDTTTTLDLDTWEVTQTIGGSCFQWMSCQQIDPPHVIGPEFCDPDRVHGPGGLS